MSQRKTVALVAVVGAILALALSPLSGIQLGFVPAFLPAFLVAVLSMEMMTAYLLWQQYSAQGELRLLGLSLTYLLTGLLLVPTALSHPYILNTKDVVGTPSTAVWLWLAWHITFPVGLAASLAPWPARAVVYVRTNPMKVGRLAIGAVLACVLAVTYLLMNHLSTIPFLGGVLDYGRMAGTLGPWLVALSGLSLVVVVVRSHTGRVMELWIVVATAASLTDSLLTVSSGARFTVGWYVGRALALTATGVVLVALARSIGLMYREALVSNQELREQNERDALTGVYSRRAILERADLLMRDGGRLAMAVVDLDHFKSINDSHGHPVGDEVLVWVAGRMATCLRSGDRVGRLGGEEFLVLLPEAGSGAAFKAGERIRRALADSTIATAAGHVRVTASVGVSARYPGDDSSDVLGRADQALYAAKAAGRNLVKSSTENQIPTAV